MALGREGLVWRWSEEDLSPLLVWRWGKMIFRLYWRQGRFCTHHVDCRASLVMTAGRVDTFIVKGKRSKKGDKMKKVGLFCFLLLMPLVAQAKLLNVDYFELDNGLQVAVVENHKAPVVLQMLFYKTGSVNDPKGKGGLAHLLEHLMFRGTSKVSDKVFNRLTDENGAQNNAYTTYAETGYYEFSDISKLELMMALEADRMHNLDVSAEAFAAERDIVLQERLQRFETQPAPLFYEALRKLLWQEHPLAQPVSGNVNEIKALKRQDVLDFYQTWYRADNALLVLAGDIKLNEAQVLVEKYYGKIKSKGEKMVPLEPLLSRPSNTSMTMKLKGIEQPRFAQYIRLDKGLLNHQDVLALELLGEYLAGDDTSYLYDKLVYVGKKLLSIDMGIAYDQNWGGTLGFYTTPVEEDMSVDDIALLIQKTTEAGVSELTVEKLQKIKNQMLSNTIYLSENPESAARFVGAMLLDGYNKEEIINYDEAIKNISLDDVKKAWEKVSKADVTIKGMLKAEKDNE